ncbi:MAG: hypothetical protein HYY91_04150 [Candidatus Omnitrophica bacterium]|nr:hypothetical protein [Candidatus Omnitrophota bacterium]
MIPWPIALLAGLYAVLGTCSAAALWRILQGQEARSPLWPMAWTVVSGAIVVGFAFLKPWARTLAIWSAAFTLVGSLSAALLAVLRPHPEPMRSVTATAMAGVYLLVLRYLTRPHVKAWFTKEPHGAHLL